MIALPFPLSHYAVPALGAGMLAAGLCVGVQTLRMHSAQAALAAERAAHAGDITLWRQAGALAVARARQSKAEAESHQIIVTAKVQDETRSRLNAFDDAMRLRPSAAGTDPARPGGAGLPGLSGGAGSADDARADTLIPREDARICGDNTIELIGWQAWYAAQHDLGSK